MIGAFLWAIGWTNTHRDLLAEIGGGAGLAKRLGLAVFTWGLAFFLVARARQRHKGYIASLILLISVELGAFYYLGGTTRWNWPVAIPESSPVLNMLLRDPGVVRVGGPLDDLPVRAGLTTAALYTGFPLLPPNRALKAAQERRTIDTDSLNLLRRCRVTHVVWDTPLSDQAGSVIFEGADPALDAIVYRPPGSPAKRKWRVVRLNDVFPEARVAAPAAAATKSGDLVNPLSVRHTQDEAQLTPGGASQPIGSLRAQSARVIRWDGLSGEVEHAGTCDLILTRAYYPGWVAKVGNLPEQPVAMAEGGLTAIRLQGAGVSRVVLQFRHGGFFSAAVVSVAAIALATAVIGKSLLSRAPGPVRTGHPLSE
jgi:hypothetical protein